MVGSEDVPEAALVRSVRATALGRGTQGVPDLRRLVEGALHTAFPYRIWVAGRVGDVRSEPRVGLHFTLLASAADDEPFQLPCLLPDEALPQVAEVLERVHDADIDDLVVEGRLARAGGLLRYDFGRGTLVLLVSELDPAATARGMQEERDAARAFVREHALSERQRSRAARTAPLSVSLVGAAEDAAVVRVRELLGTSPYAVDLRDVRVPLQGRQAPVAVADAVREAALRSDVVLVVRAQGRPLTLAVFDASEVCSAVAQAPVPVVCALGGGTETTASDDLAHATLPDGDAAARWVLDRLQEAERSLQALAAEIDDQAGVAGERARAALGDAHDDVQHVAAEAEGRAAVARRRLQLRVLAGATLVAVGLVVAALATGTPLLLLGLLVLALLLGGARQWSAWAMRRGSRPMSQQDDDFTAVLARLRQVRDELASTSSPEAVHRLRDAAAQLVAHGEQILGRHLEPRDRSPELAASGSG